MAAPFDLGAIFRVCPSSTSPSQPFSGPFLSSLPRPAAASPSGGDPEALPPERTVVRLGLPSKGRMADETLSILKNCQLSVRQVNPRQYVADIPQLSNLEVWFQRPKDIVHKLQSGDLDIGIVGFDSVSEYGQGNEDLIVVHDALEFGACRLSLAMGIADAIIDLVSSGTTLHENDLKEIEGGVVLESQAVFVASKRSLNTQEGVLEITHEILERVEAHLRATGQVTVVANMRGNSAKEVAERILSQTSLSGLQGPTISPVYCKRDRKVVVDYYAIVICVPQKTLYKSVQQLRSIGGSGVLVSDLTYIFEEETPRWRKLLSQLGL